ncbi:TPA: hypothetical protein ACH270_005408 [Klebsiella oxytoca]
MTSKLTRDIIQSEIVDFFAGVVEIHTELGGPNTVEEAQNQLTERVLACVPAVDSEPVAEVCEDYAIRYISSGPAPKEGLHPGDKLYRHAQPVVPPELTRERYLEYFMRDDWRDNFRSGWDACRAAMLNGGKS